MSTIADQITSLTNATTELKAKTDTVTGAASENLTQSDFLELLTKQLQFQDPMSPQDNSQFVSQMCQFSQLEVTSGISSTLSDYTSVMEAKSLVGNDVILKDPNNPSSTMAGAVQAAYIDGSDSAITVNGVNYPLKYLMYAYTDEAAKAGQAAQGDSQGASQGN